MVTKMIWKNSNSIFVYPGFTIPEIKEIVNPRKMAVALADSKRVKGKLNHMKDHLIGLFHLPEIEDDTICENHRRKF